MPDALLVSSELAPKKRTAVAETATHELATTVQPALRCTVWRAICRAKLSPLAADIRCGAMAS